MMRLERRSVECKSLLKIKGIDAKQAEEPTKGGSMKMMNSKLINSRLFESCLGLDFIYFPSHVCFKLKDFPRFAP